MAETYKVEEVLERQRITDTGKIAKFYRLQVRTMKGTAFTLDVPESQMGTDEVKAALEAKAAELDRVLEL